MMVKSVLDSFYFEILLAPSEGIPFRAAPAQCRQICPERLNWPGGLAGISEGASRISKQKILDHFSPPLLAQKCWFQDLRF